jgi:outer membrane protein OmpA-like peptidoglycan-associated protein
MKQIIPILIFIFNLFTGYSQNLVKNSSFEDCEIPRTSKSFWLGNLNDWNDIIDDTWYFNRNSIDDGYVGPSEFRKVAVEKGLGIPYNFIGKQEPHSGNAYIAIESFCPGDIVSGIPVLVQGNLSETLIKGHLYYAELFVSKADNYSSTTSSVWISFSDKEYRTTDTVAYYTNLPKQIKNPSNNFIIDAKGWQKVSGTFVAKGNEKFIGIGSSPTAETLKGNGTVFLFVDDVLVKEIKDTLIIEKDKALVLKNISFEIGSSILTANSYPELEKLNNYLLLNPLTKLEISGHTDNTGIGTENIKLSEERAKSVGKYLIEKGISTERLKYKGYGSSKSIDTNETSVGRQNNRRVEVKIINFN